MGWVVQVEIYPSVVFKSWRVMELGGGLKPEYGMGNEAGIERLIGRSAKMRKAAARHISKT